MKQTEAMNRAKQKYEKEKLDHVNLRMPKGKKEVIKAHIAESGESINGFINRAIDETLKRDCEKI